jgi:hypothetical protein
VPIRREEPFLGSKQAQALNPVYEPFARPGYFCLKRRIVREVLSTRGHGIQKAGRHMHVSELAHLLSCMKNEHVIITHTTQRTPMQEVRRVLEEALPPEVYAKTTLLMDRKRRTR